MSLAPGSRVGTFEVSVSIGEGGMGRVYRARDTQLGRDVALKILPDSFAHDPERLARFRREAQVLASLNHPHIGAIYGIEELRPASAGLPASLALVLEYIDGPTLDEWITARTRKGGSGAPIAASTARLSSIHNLEDTLAIARQIVDALDAAHALGVVHRDLKPANIKVRPDGTVKVLDFGLAKFGDPLTAASDVTELANSPTLTSPAMTALGMILGTAAYMSPEQAKGRVVDKRADIWAFGCVLFEMLTGKRAFEGSDVSDTLANILKSEPDWSALPAETPASLRRLLRRCLNKEPASRLSDIGVARLEIADAMSGEPAGAGASTTAAAVAPPKRSRWLGLAAAAGVGALVGFGPMAATYFAPAPAGPPAVRFAVPVVAATFPNNAASSSAAMSPDGRMVAYRAFRPQQRAHVWVRAIDALEARELTGTEGAGQMFWSPDSRTIAFTADGKLKRIEATGGPVQTIADVGAGGMLGGSWNADGVIIVGHGTGPLSRVPAAGGTLEPLTTLDESAKEVAHTFPQFLPDGRRFLFGAAPGGAVYVGSFDDKGRTRVAEFESNVQFSAGRLVFLRQNTLFAQPFDASSGALTGEPVPLAENVSATTLPGARYGRFSASLDGDLVYEPATVEPGGTPVWVDRTGREMGPVLAGVQNARFPRVSPDGRSLTLTVSDDVWVADLGGAPPIRLTSDGVRTPHYSPLWSLDGTRIVYESDSPSDLRSVPSDGSGGTPIAMSPSGHIHPHGWSKDGQLLVAVDFLNGPDIITLSTDGKFERKELVANATVAEGNLGAELSPDRNWLAYVANSTGQTEIWVRPFPGPGAAVRVSPNGGVDPAWSRDGREIFYLEGSKMMAVTVKGGVPPQYGMPATLFEREYVGAGEQPPSFAVAPGGRFIMIKAIAASAAVPDSLTVVLGWSRELGARTNR